METYRTSFCRPQNLVIHADGRGLLFEQLPSDGSFDKMVMRLISEQGEKVISGEIDRYGRNYVSTSHVADGQYSLVVYNLVSGTNTLMGYLYDHDAMVKITGGVPSFVEPWCMRQNMAIAKQFSRSRETIQQLLAPHEAYPCNHPEIKHIAQAVTRGISDEYQKLLTIHDWVAENIFYDMDCLHREGPLVVADDKPIIQALRTHRAVCAGYSDLAVALLRACGVPAVSVECFALGQTTTGGWERRENRVDTANHAFTAALIRDRYVLMDVTWDSDNVYSGGRYQHKTGLGKKRKYFDTSHELFAASHRLIASSRQWN